MLALVTLLAVLLAGCDTFANYGLSRASERWHASHLAHYRYRLSIGCFCGYTPRMPLTIEVRAGQVAQMKYRDGTPVPSGDRLTFAQFETVDALLNFTAHSIRQAESVRAEYDPQYGFPVRIQLDRPQNETDQPLAVYVSDFQPLP